MIDYEQQLKRLEKAVPKHPLLWAFRRGHTASNALLLARALDKIPPPPVVIQDDDPEPPDDVDDDTMRRFRMDQSNLFSDRRKLSNEFHTCQSDRQRAGVSERIQIVQAQIERLKQQINIYKEQGRIPEPDEKYPVPEDPFKLLALRASLRASISRKKRKIVQIGRDQDKLPDAPERLAKAEGKLKELKLHLNHVKKAIQDRDIQPGRLS